MEGPRSAGDHEWGGGVPRRRPRIYLTVYQVAQARGGPFSTGWWVCETLGEAVRTHGVVRSHSRVVWADSTPKPASDPQSVRLSQNRVL
jgi:hypothetical protein